MIDYSQRHNYNFHIFFYIWILICTQVHPIHSQFVSTKGLNNQSPDKYAWPVLGVRAVTGTFGEYRSTHFHLGMDFSTGGKRGLPIVSISKGRIVKVQRHWYSIGNAITIVNEDGIEVRYGHLSKFSPKIIKKIKDSIVSKSFQSRRDFVLELDEPIEVDKGEIIAYSGDTGIGPPHLHLELYKNGIYYNPKDFGFGSENGEEIYFNFITFRPESNRSFINGKHEPLTIPITKEESGNRLDSEEGIRIQGLVSIQLSGYQKSNTNRLGLQNISIDINARSVMRINFREIPKNESKKFVLMYDAYKSKTNGDPFLYNLYSREGNGISGLGDTMVGSGIISSYNLNLDKNNTVVITARGLGENVGELYLNLIRDENDYSYIVTPTISYNVKRESYTSLSSLDKSLELFFPAHSVYVPAKFEIQEIDDNSIQMEGMTLESKIFRISPEEFREFNLGYDLYVKVGYKTDLTKCSLFEITRSGKVIPVIGANISSWGKFFKARMKRTGTFAIFKDIIPPDLYLIGGYNEGHIFKNSNFEIIWQLNDSGSGFDQNSVLVNVDGQAAVAEINPNNNQAVIVEPQSLFEPGEHKMEITVFDRMGNRSETKNFRYKVEGGRVASNLKRDVGKDNKILD